MRITVLFTGGTIGSESNGSYVDVHFDTTEPLFGYYYKSYPQSRVRFNKKHILNTLSENIIGENWIKIANEAREVSNSCDGIIITHGTDTLAYTASFLSFALADVDLPIMLVSSNLPLESHLANGYKNFNAAVDFILNEHTKGVFVPIYNGKTTEIHIASRLTEAQPFTHMFKSLGNISYGEMNNGLFELNNSIYNTNPEELNNNSFSFDMRSMDLANVFIVRPYPDLNYDNISLNNKPKAILHGLYHSGTACVSCKSPNLNVLRFAERCNKADIDIYAAPFDKSISPYKSTKEMVDSGIQVLEDISLESAYIKLKIAYGIWSDKSNIIDFMNKNIAFEKIQKRDIKT